MGRVDRDMMKAAIEAAGSHHTHPNPRVGAVVVTADGVVAGRGSHAGPGRPHAELVALEAAGDQAAGSTLYVTLEPCVHHGRTPPCTEAILAAGVERVVVAIEDPDPQVAGQGFAALRAAGIDVTIGVLAAQAAAIDPAYFHHRRTGRPRVTLKAALTLDGQVAAADGTSQWITSVEARLDGHRLRAEADAVMVGAGTVFADDPRLTVRTEGYEGPQPLPVVVAGRRPLPADAAVFSRPAIVFAPAPQELPGEVILAPAAAGTKVDLARALDALGGRGIVDLLVEGGSTLAAAFLAERLIDRGVFYVGASLGGGTGLPVFGGVFASLGDARSVEITRVQRVGPDIKIEFEMGVL